MASVRQKVNYYRRRGDEATGQIARGVIPPGAKAARQAQGAIVFSSMMSGHDDSPTGNRLPATVEGEAVVLFQHISDFMEKAGGSTDDIVNLTLLVMDDSYRKVADDQMAKSFPDAARRPSYHVLNVAPSGLRNERIQAILAASVSH